MRMVAGVLSESVNQEFRGAVVMCDQAVVAGVLSESVQLACSSPFGPAPG